MKNALRLFPDKVIVFCFYLLFFLVPLILTPFNYELFEYNKMMATYALTAVIVGTWIIKMAVRREIKFARSPIDIPLVFFLVSQFVSTFFSIDRHVSVWGYYSRFNGGLLSTVCYFLLYYAFISNFPKAKILNLFSVMLTSGVLVSLYGILERLGIDKNIWMQDVQNRVFSTLGQPNWLAAYLAVLIPIITGLGIYKLTSNNDKSEIINQKSKIKNQKESIKSSLFGLLSYWVIGLLFYLTLIFTKSRSGFLGFWIANSVFWMIFFIKYRIQFVKLFIILNSLFLILTFLFGTPFQQLNRFSFPELTKNKQTFDTAQDKQLAIKPTGDSIIDVGITESGKIRNIVWKGAVDIFRAYPLFGSGVETFAFAYYKYRPAEHNLTSEWDFLYNKAHNEYLNFAATTGAFGLGSYLLIIGSFIWWNIIKLKSQISNLKTKLKTQNREDEQKVFHFKLGFDQVRLGFDFCTLHFALFTAWLSILITNFFGFSVVIIQLFFFLIPAISFLLTDNLTFVYLLHPETKDETINNIRYSLSVILLFGICYLLFVIFRLWYADTIFATGYHYTRTQEYFNAYESIKNAVSINRNEPFYFDELAIPAGILAVSFKDENQATISSQLENEALFFSNAALAISPNNVNFWKTRTRVFYVLSALDGKYLAEAAASLEVAKILSPTDPKILYNLAVMYDKFGKKSQAIDSLIQATKLKPDYRDAYLALALFYDRDKEKQKAREALNFILQRINPEDAEAKKKLEELK